MITSSGLLFFFSGLGVFNGLILAAYFLFFTKKEELAHKLLGLLLLLLSIRIGKSVVYFFYRDLGEFYRQIGLSACFLIGPTLYYYLSAELERIQKLPKRWKYSFGLLLALAITFGVLYPYASYPALWNSWVVRVIYGLWMIYILFSAWVVRSLLIKLLRTPGQLVLRDIWLLCIFLGNALIFVAFSMVPYTPYIVGALSFSLVLYLLLFVLFFSQLPILKQFRASRYNNNTIPDEEGDQLADELGRLMREEQLYRNPKLKIGDLAAAMDISVHRLSQFLNDNLAQNYASYVNQWRVELAKELIVQEHHLSLEGIGAEAGFSSKSTFYAVFKKAVGQTPAQYRKAKMAQTSPDL